MGQVERIEVGVRELKARLSEYLRKVKSGKVVIVTEYGKPISRMLPYAESLVDKLQAAESAGVVSWTGRKWEPSGPVSKIRGEKTVADMILEDRE